MCVIIIICYIVYNSILWFDGGGSCAVSDHVVVPILAIYTSVNYICIIYVCVHTIFLSVSDFAAVIRRVIRVHAILLNIRFIGTPAPVLTTRESISPQPFLDFRESGPDIYSVSTAAVIWLWPKKKENNNKPFNFKFKTFRVESVYSSFRYHCYYILRNLRHNATRLLALRTVE